MKKFINEFHVQEMVEGKWCDAGEEVSYTLARATARTYRVNGYSARAITRRVLNRDAAISTAVLKYCRDFYREFKAWPEMMVVHNKNGTIKFTLSLEEMREILGQYDCRLVEQPVSKAEAYRAGAYKFKAPSVCSTRWEDSDWINFIDAYHGWTIPVLDN